MAEERKEIAPPPLLLILLYRRGGREGVPKKKGGERLRWVGCPLYIATYAYVGRRVGKQAHYSPRLPANDECICSPNLMGGGGGGERVEARGNGAHHHKRRGGGGRRRNGMGPAVSSPHSDCNDGGRRPKTGKLILATPFWGVAYFH